MKFYYFTASWCSPCKIMKPAIKEYPEIEVVDVDPEEGSIRAAKFNVRGLPTLIAYDEVADKQVGQLVGAVPRSQLKIFMEKHRAE